VIAEPSLKQRFAEIGFDATPMSADEVSAAMKQLETRMAPVITRLNIKLD
jgi:hypothetical protein